MAERIHGIGWVGKWVVAGRDWAGVVCGQIVMYEKINSNKTLKSEKEKKTAEIFTTYPRQHVQLEPRRSTGFVSDL